MVEFPRKTIGEADILAALEEAAAQVRASLPPPPWVVGGESPQSISPGN